ncbi:MAG: M20/M25/M40 family metallo-hydrolase, partial [Chloroflexota bacterium]|nr:M20/M25/M40 family metallo-hydrolase [Chloroflexota bacterium]
MSTFDLEIYPPPDKRQPPPAPPVARAVSRRKWTGILPDKFIAVLTDLVSQTNLSNWVHHLSSYHTRHTQSTYIDQAATWLSSQFSGFGYGSVVSHQYSREGHQLKNIICTKPGSDSNPKLVIVCAHYDSINVQGGVTDRAPGADDNATGVAVLLELARILADVDLRDTVQFAAFSGEEQGYWGSTAYAQHLQDGGINVHRLINLDQVGVPPADNAINIERDMGNSVSSNDQLSQALGDTMAQMAADYSDMPVLLSHIYGSDYMPFEARGWVVAGAYEAGHNPHYHTSNDAVSMVDFAYVTQVARMTLATLLHLCLDVTDESGSAVNLFIRDSATDTGDQPSMSPHWKSPDIWVRNNPPPADPTDPTDPNFGEDPAAGHQAPINGVPNYMYVQVHNRGTQPASGIVVKAFHCDPGTAMLFPTHFQQMGTISYPGSIAAGASVPVGPFIWTPQIVDHECLLAIASAPADHSLPEIYSGQLDHSLLVRYDNNVGQRNVSPQNAVPGGKTKTSFLVRGGMTPSSNTLSIDASQLPEDTDIQLRVPVWLATTSVTSHHVTSVSQNSRWVRLALPGGKKGQLIDFPLDVLQQGTVTMEIDFSHQAEHLKVYPIIIGQEQDGVLTGQLTIEITAVKESEDYVYGNPRSMELHTIHCPYWPRISQKNKIPF